MSAFNKLRRQLSLRLFVAILILDLLLIAAYWTLNSYLGLSSAVTILVLVFAAAAGAAGITTVVIKMTLQPLQFLQQAIEHLSLGQSVPAPTPEKLSLGRELITKLIHEVYRLASQTSDLASLSPPHISISQTASIDDNMPLPVLVMDRYMVIRHANQAALNYCSQKSASLLGKKLYDLLDLSFPNENTYESWLKNCRAQKISATGSWERVRLKLADNPEVRQLDLVASYNKDNPSGIESIIVLFDRSQRYNQDDQNLSYIALAVHELRTPLTALRGYIEVFQEELADKLSPELTDFMHKMQVSAVALTAFVNNILNVARVEENQLVLRLNEESWPAILRNAVAQMQMLANVHGKTIILHVASDLPSVGVDRVSILEVIYNLLDNAIKYSPDGAKHIIVRSNVNQEGLVETSVQDFGVGIDTAVLPNLFDKFYRNHKTRGQIGGSGLGLYLCRAIVKAHSGNIWVRSKEGEGSTFGFTLLPYASLGDELKSSGNKDITRNAYGWIKNHSLYRR